MLVLSRKPGESLIIGEHVTVTIVEAKGGRVRLGIEAPRDVAVHRNEVKQRIDLELLQKPGSGRPHEQQPHVVLH